MRSLWLIGLILFSNSLAPLAVRAEPASAWWTHALRLTGEKEQVRRNSIEALRQIPALEELLRKELRGERKFLALDVITALKLRGLFEDLLQAAETDSTGAVYASLNSLIDDRTLERTKETYRSRVMSARTAPAAKMVLIDTLARMNVILERGELERLLRDPSFEVRGASLGYLRHVVIDLDEPDALELVKSSFHENPWQLKLQALSLISESSIRARRPLVRLLDSCRSDPNADVATECRRLSKGGSP